MGKPTEVAVASLFVCFSLFFASKVNLPGPHLKSLVLLSSMLASSILLVTLRWPMREKIVLPLAFFVPMVDRLIYVGSIRLQVFEDAALYLGLPLAVLFLGFHVRPSEVGISLGRRRETFKMVALLGCGAIAMSFVGLAFPSMTRYYPLWASGPVDFSGFLYNETMIAVLMFCGEFFFRGAILFSLSRRSFWGAVVFQALPYALLHLGKPPVEVPYSLVAGLIFGWADLRSRSILPSWIAHAGGSALFDLLVLSTGLS